MSYFSPQLGHSSILSFSLKLYEMSPVNCATVFCIPSLKENKNVIKKCPNIFSSKEQFKFLQMNPRAPSLYGLPKIHKQDRPVRPVVS